MRGLQNFVENNRDRRKEWEALNGVDFEKEGVFTSLIPHQFDARFTVRITKGVSNLEELYHKMSCWWGLGKIKTDVLSRFLEITWFFN